MAPRHRERHLVHRIGWLRAAVLGANDGILSTSSLLVGVATGAQDRSTVLLAGVAALMAGAFSMAAGEYVSVSSQSDTEAADLALERQELASQPAFEREELANLYVARGLELELARKVADQLMARDALAAHARDELGISEIAKARPLQAALTSAVTFSSGALLPLLAAVLAPRSMIAWAVFGAALIALGVLGVVGARTGGASVWRSLARVTFWGALAMAATAGVGALFGAAA